MHPSNTPSRLSSKDYPPKLTPEEASLLVNNHGCMKCHKLYIFHMKFECPNDFPKGTGYKAVTQAGVDAMRCAHETKTKKTISAVAPVLSNATTGPSSHPVAAIMDYTSNPVGNPVNYSSAVLSNDLMKMGLILQRFVISWLWSLRMLIMPPQTP